MQSRKQCPRHLRVKVERPEIIARPYYPPGLSDREINLWYDRINLIRSRRLGLIQITKEVQNGATLLEAHVDWIHSG